MDLKYGDAMYKLGGLEEARDFQAAKQKNYVWRQSNAQDPHDPFVCWCEGRTGVPFIDANMKELVATGY